MTTLGFFRSQRQIIDSLDFDRSNALEQQIQLLNVEMMNSLRELGEICHQAPDSMMVMFLAKKLTDHITANYYICTDEILFSFGAMYAGGGDFTSNIDKVGGKGTAVFAHKAIEALVATKQK